jgi:hypothetical protein
MSRILTCRKLFRISIVLIAIAPILTLSAARTSGLPPDGPHAQDLRLQRKRDLGPGDRAKESTRRARPDIDGGETCWRPGLARNIGIAEQSCETKR